VPFTVRANRFLRRLRNLLLLVLIVECVAIALTTPRLAVRRVQVTGTTMRTPQEIARVAGLEKPVNIFLAPAGKAEHRLGALPEVASVDVYRTLPDTLCVSVVEREPVATVMTDGGYWEMDGGGIIFRKLSRPLPGQPLLRVRPASVPQLAKPLALPTLKPALETLKALKASPLPPDSTMVVDTKNTATIQCRDGLKVRLGPVDSGKERLATLTRILTGKDGERIRREAAVIDLATPRGEVMIPRAPVQEPGGDNG
jgi:cell division protein FtsQ